MRRRRAPRRLRPRGWPRDWFFSSVLLVEGLAPLPKLPRQPKRSTRARTRTLHNPDQMRSSPEKAEPAVAVAALRRDYGDRPALDGVAFELAAGESLVVLGPNGA